MTGMTSETKQSIAVVGSGVAGLVAAYRLSQPTGEAPGARVTLFEADSRLGGHAHTHQVPMPDGRTVAVDSGFIVHNDRTYPTLLALYDELGVPTQETDMSMSVHSRATGLEYAGALGVSGLFPTAANLLRPRYLKMLTEVKRFHQAAQRLLDTPDSDEPLSEFVAREGFSQYFLDHFLLPLVAAVWSCEADVAARYPARYLFTFLEHHGMLTVFGSPTWRTVSGGSVTYVEMIAARLGRSGEIRPAAPVRSIEETSDGIRLVAEGAGPEHFDAVVVATHPHQALSMLASPTPAQHRVLSALPYSAKEAVLHTDISLLPRARRAWASWNYQIRDDAPPATETVLDGSGVAVTYDLTRLMRLPVTDPRMLVTVGRTDLVDPATVIARMTYEHPVYTGESVRAQALLPDIDTDRVFFAGAYHGWGFHEDGALSGTRAAERLRSRRSAAVTPAYLSGVMSR